jgi:hypothetical protein
MTTELSLNKCCARLEDSLHLPLHWSYSDAWYYDYENSNWLDNRQPGFQVWSSVARAVFASSGNDCDGSYGIKDGYKYLLVINATDWEDSSGEWFAVRPCDVKECFYIEIEKVLNWALDKWEKDVEDGFDAYSEEDGGFEKWCEDSEEEINNWVSKNMVAFTPDFIETLTCPE